MLISGTRSINRYIVFIACCIRPFFALNLPKTFYYCFPSFDKHITYLITSILRYFTVHFVFWLIKTFVLVLLKSTRLGT